MKNKAILVSFIALFAIVFALNVVTASAIVDITEVRVNEIVADENSLTVAGLVSEVVPVDVEFKAEGDFSDVRVRVYIEGYKGEISDITPRFHVVGDSKYIKRFSLRLPSSVDLDDLTEELNLYVRVSAKGEDEVENLYPITMQRNLYSLNFLSVEMPQNVLAGSTVALDVVLQNNGNERLDNTYVMASIPELGVEKKVYFGDLHPEEEDDYDHIRDTTNRRVYLSIPKNTIPGEYNIKIEAYNYDTTVTAEKTIVIEDVKSGVLPATSAKTISIGEEATFEVLLVNPSDEIIVFSITPEESTGLIVEVLEPTVAVSADSSRVVKVRVKATNSAEEGTHIFTVNVNSESGFVKQTSFTLNVEEKAKATTDAVLVLTVILVIIFIVLLIVLIVLLTKRPEEEPEEFGETSYY